MSEASEDEGRDRHAHPKNQGRRHGDEVETGQDGSRHDGEVIEAVRSTWPRGHGDRIAGRSADERVALGELRPRPDEDVETAVIGRHGDLRLRYCSLEVRVDERTQSVSRVPVGGRVDRKRGGARIAPPGGSRITCEQLGPYREPKYGCGAFRASQTGR